MSDLNFVVLAVEATEHAAQPIVTFTLRASNPTPEHPIQAGFLRCQIRIEPTRRNYQPEEKANLLDLFGEPSRWGLTLRSMLWTHATVMLPVVETESEFEMPIPCTFDFNMAATKYFAGLVEGEIPLTFLFSGTVFRKQEPFGLQASQIPWDREARFRMPQSVWAAMMDHYYPNGAWLRLRRDVFDRLHAFKREHGLTDWEKTLESLLDRASG